MQSRWTHMGKPLSLSPFDIVGSAIRTAIGTETTRLNISYSRSTPSSTVILDFQGTIAERGSHIDLRIDNGQYKAVASPRTITGLSDGPHTIYLRVVDKEGKRDPSPAQWKFSVIDDNDGYPDTWINWVRATPRGVNIANGGSTSSSTVTVDFQGTVAGRGSHIDLKIDNGPYEPVASRHKIADLSVGKHTIYLKAINQKGQEDPTPAKWTFIVGEDDEQPPQPPPVVCAAILKAGVETDKAVYHPGDTVKISGGFNSPDGVDEDGLVKLEWNNSNPITRATATVVPRHNECGTDFVYTATLGQDVQLKIGNWTVRALWGEGEASTTFEVVEKEGGGKPKLDPKQDLDGDGLLNSWEQDGIDVNQDGKVDLNLATLGADPYHKDVFLEIDYMEHHKPIEESLSDVMSAFANSPVPNPDGVNGITLHFDVDEQVPHQDITRPHVEFPQIKVKYFGTAEERADPNSDNILSPKNALFQYVVYGHSEPWACGYGNCKNISIAFARFIASNDPHPQGGRDLQAMMLMHELGHNLGLVHGGPWEEKDVDFKPNYLSNMQSIFYWGIPTLDFSRCELPPLDERNLDESAGVGTSCPPGRLTGYFHEGYFYTTQTGVPVNWNRDGDVQDVGVVADINDDGEYTVLHG